METREKDCLASATDEHGPWPSSILVSNSIPSDNLDFSDLHLNEDIHSASDSWNLDLRSCSEFNTTEAVKGSQSRDDKLAPYMDFLSDPVSCGYEQNGVYNCNETALLPGRISLTAFEYSNSLPCFDEPEFELISDSEKEHLIRDEIETVGQFALLFIRKLEKLRTVLCRNASNDRVIEETMEELKFKVQHLEKEADKLRSENKKLECIKDLLIESRDAALQGRLQNNATNTDLSKQNEALKEKVEHLQRRCDHEVSQVAQMSYHRNVLLNDLKTLRRDLKFTQTRLTTVEEENSRLKKENENLHFVICDLQDGSYPYLRPQTTYNHWVRNRSGDIPTRAAYPIKFSYKNGNGASQLDDKRFVKKSTQETFEPSDDDLEVDKSCNMSDVPK